MKKFEGRVAAVTGAGSGIGRAIAIALAQRGCDVALSDINEATARETANEIGKLGRRTSVRAVDVAKAAQVRDWADAAAREHGRINIVVNNAGVGVGVLFEEHTLEDWEWIVGINFWGVVYGCKFFLPHLRKEDEGHIVNISSAAGIVPAPGMSSYAATKYAVRGLSESLRIELRKTGIGVTSVHPGVINTNIPKATRYRMTNAEKVRDEGSAIFEKWGRPPEAVASKVVKAIEKNSERVLVGPDAYLLDFMKRAAPTLADDLMGRIPNPLMGR